MTPRLYKSSRQTAFAAMNDARPLILKASRLSGDRRAARINEARWLLNYSRRLRQALGDQT